MKVKTDCKKGKKKILHVQNCGLLPIDYGLHQSIDCKKHSSDRTSRDRDDRLFIFSDYFLSVSLYNLKLFYFQLISTKLSFNDDVVDN
jgi:hypothetical protein